MTTLLFWLITVYLWVLIARWIIDLVMAFSRSFRPTGFMAMVFEFVYSVTDPPLKFLRRFIPPLRMGNVALDLSFLVLVLGLQLLRLQL